MCVASKAREGASIVLQWGWVLEAFLSLPCLCTFFRSIPTRNEVFFRNFSPQLCSFWGFLNHSSNTTWFTSKYDITLQTSASSLAMSLRLCYSPPNMISHCRQTLLSLATRSPLLLISEHDVTLQMNVFITSDEIAPAIHLRTQHHTADKHVYS